MPKFSVVLVEPKYEGNIGSVARVMKNLGFQELILVNPPQISKEARIMAMHGVDILENSIVVNNFKKIRGWFDFLVATTAIVAGDRNPMRTPVFPEDLLNSLDVEGDIALVFGREDYGLYNDEIGLCDLIVTIPANPEYPTLNLSQSVAIILYEISRLRLRKELHDLKKFRRLNKIEKEVLLEKFDSLADSLYENDFELKLVKKTFRQLIGRAFISGREAFTLIGLFRRARDRIKKSALKFYTNQHQEEKGGDYNSAKSGEQRNTCE